MLHIKAHIADAILAGVRSLYPAAAAGDGLDTGTVAGLLEYPPDPAMGDLSLPCFQLSKRLRRAPAAIAASLAPLLPANGLWRAEAVSGYLNFRLSGAGLASAVIPRILEEGERYGAPDIGRGRTVVLDYSSPNVAKPFHIGHLGSTVIGHSLKKIHEFAGYRCVGVNHLGDWGTQFGKLILAYRLWGNREAIERGGCDEIVKLYVRVNREISGDEERGVPPRPDLADQAREEFRKMEAGDRENIALREWFCRISLEEYERTYRQLGISFDSCRGESFYVDRIPAQVERMRKAGILKQDGGAWVVDLGDYDMPPCLILKRDGSTLYPTRDIAAAAYRMETYHFDRCIYVTSTQQILYFRQLFRVIGLMGYDWADRLVHVPYGTVSVNGLKLATRTGNVVLLKDLFRAAIAKVTEIMEEKNPALTGRTDIAEAVGVGAVVFHYLMNSRIKDMDFDMDQALSFDGNTGPYVQYTYARACSVLEKAGDLAPDAWVPPASVEAREKDLCLVLSQYEERVRAALKDYEPSVITRYILDVAAAFNRFYHDCAILSAGDETVRGFRLCLVQSVKHVLGSALGLVCLRKTEQI